MRRSIQLACPRSHDCPSHNVRPRVGRRSTPPFSLTTEVFDVRCPIASRMPGRHLAAPPTPAVFHARKSAFRGSAASSGRLGLLCIVARWSSGRLQPAPNLVSGPPTAMSTAADVGTKFRPGTTPARVWSRSRRPSTRSVSASRLRRCCSRNRGPPSPPR